MSRRSATHIQSLARDAAACDLQPTHHAANAVLLVSTPTAEVSVSSHSGKECIRQVASALSSSYTVNTPVPCSCIAVTRACMYHTCRGKAFCKPRRMCLQTWSKGMLMCGDRANCALMGLAAHTTQLGGALSCHWCVLDRTPFLESGISGDARRIMVCCTRARFADAKSSVSCGVLQLPMWCLVAGGHDDVTSFGNSDAS